jgi:hypothetical protein
MSREGFTEGADWLAADRPDEIPSRKHLFTGRPPSCLNRPETPSNQITVPTGLRDTRARWSTEDGIPSSLPRFV